MPDPSDLARAIAILTEDDPPRVWSFIITIFGDLAQGEGDAMSGRLLARMAQVAGLKPETVRVALHRLRKDGWIDSHRDGRRSRYTLTAYGRAQSAAAAPRIYADAAPKPRAWTVLIADPNGTDDALAEIAGRTDAVPLGTFGMLVPEPVTPDDRALLRVTSDAVDIPDWVRAATCPDDLKRGYQGLRSRLGCVEPLIAPSAASLESATVRVLVVHSWRRVLLRHADLPTTLFPADWPGEDCRRAVMAILARLPRPRLQVLEAEAAD